MDIPRCIWLSKTTKDKMDDKTKKEIELKVREEIIEGVKRANEKISKLGAYAYPPKDITIEQLKGEVLMQPGDWVLANGRVVCHIKECRANPVWDNRDRFYFDAGISWAWVEDCQSIEFYEDEIRKVLNNG